MTTISRRSILQTIGAMTATGMATVGMKNAAANVVVPEKWDKTCDVLVIGGGDAGMFAAVAAREAGADVILLEKAPSLFANSSSLSAGSANATGTKAQIAAGVKDIGNEKEFAQEIMKTGKGIADPVLVKLFAENSKYAMDWLTDHGVIFTPQANAAFRMKRMLGCNKHTGAQYVEVLAEAAKKIGVKIEMRTRAEELITNMQADQVLGVTAVRGKRRISYRAKKAVIIATGGFCGDVSMIDRYILDFKGALTFSSMDSTGDGLKMACKIGAGTTHMNFAAVYAYGVPMDSTGKSRRGWIYRGHVMNLYGPITVGPDAKRFVNDDLGATSISQAMHVKGFNTVYQIATEAQLEDFMKNDAIQVIGWSQEEFRKEMKEQKVFIKKADTIEELAKKLGLDPKALQATLNRYNGFVKAGKDEDFNRKYMKGTFEKGPYYGFVCLPIAGISIGGLRVDGNLNVLDVYDKPIKGLLAAGEAIGGVHGGSYIGGNSVGASLTLGQLAGKLAAKLP